MVLKLRLVPGYFGIMTMSVENSASEMMYIVSGGALNSTHSFVSQKWYKYVCITTYQPDSKSNRNPNLLLTARNSEYSTTWSHMLYVSSENSYKTMLHSPSGVTWKRVYYNNQSATLVDLVVISVT